MIQGDIREDKGFKKYVGVGEFHVLGFNFERETVAKRFNYDPGKEQEYVKKMKIDKLGGQEVDTVNVIAFMKHAQSGEFMKTSFLLKKITDISSSGKTKYVNTKCVSTYALSGNKMADRFVTHSYREAFEGECDFLHFMRCWLDNFDWDFGNAQYPLKETALLFDGKFGALNDLANRFPKSTVGVLCGIRETDKGQRQDTCNRAFLPTYQIDRRTGVNNVTYIQNILVGSRNGSNPTNHPFHVNRFIDTVEGQYGYKNFFGNSYKFREYDPTTNVVAGTNSAIVDDLSY